MNNKTDFHIEAGVQVLDALTNTMLVLAPTDKKSNLKRKEDKYTDLGQILIDHPLRVFVQRTTRRTVAPYAGGFKFHAIKTPAPIYFFSKGYDPDFEEKKQKREDDITMIKARIEYDKLKELHGSHVNLMNKLNSIINK